MGHVSNSIGTGAKVHGPTVARLAAIAMCLLLGIVAVPTCATASHRFPALASSLPRRCIGVRFEGRRVTVAQHGVGCHRARRVAHRFLFSHRLPNDWEAQGGGDELNLHPSSSAPCCVAGKYVYIGDIPGAD